MLVGNESLSPPLWLLTATELYSNAPFYVKHPKLTEAVNDCGLPEVSLFIQCLSKNGLKSWDEKMDHVAAVQREAIGGCTDGEWSCMFHVMALATVLGRQIFSAFPDCGVKTRPLFQGYISPCSSNVQSTDVDAKSPAMILWSIGQEVGIRPTILCHCLSATDCKILPQKRERWKARMKLTSNRKRNDNGNYSQSMSRVTA